jgi:hypothetical protein
VSPGTIENTVNERTRQSGTEEHVGKIYSGTGESLP